MKVKNEGFNGQTSINDPRSSGMLKVDPSDKGTAGANAYVANGIILDYNDQPFR